MTDKQSECRPIPDERDQIEAPLMPDLRCREHGNVCEVMHSIYNRLILLESRIRTLEERK